MVELIRAPDIARQARRLTRGIDCLIRIRFGLFLIHLRTLMQARTRTLLSPCRHARTPCADATADNCSRQPSRNPSPEQCLRPEASHCASPSRPCGVPQRLPAELESRPILLRKAIAGLLNLPAPFAHHRTSSGRHAYKKSPSRPGSAFPLRTSLG